LHLFRSEVYGMHTRNRTWNVPLGIGLFGAAILVGGAILAYPETRRAESHVDVSDPIATRPFPSFPDEAHQTIPGSSVAKPPEPRAPTMSTDPLNSAPRTAAPHEPLPAPSAVGGGPKEEESPEDDEPPRVARIVTPPPSAAPPMPPPAAAASPTATTVAAADGGAPRTTATAPGDATVAGEGGLLSTAVGDAATTDPNMPYVYPSFGTGAPTAGAATPIPGSGGVTTGATNGAGSTSSGGSVTVKAQVTAPMLVPVSGALDRFWTGVTPYLRTGDAVVAQASSETLAWSDRARTDAPLVTYVVSFSTAANLEAAIANGLPATLAVVGLQDAAGLTDALAAKVHETGRRLFVSVKLPSASLESIGKNVDLVELVAAGANGTELAEQAKTGVATLGSKPRVFVRLPAALATASAAPTVASAIVAAIPNAGVSLPANESLKMSDYRAR